MTSAVNEIADILRHAKRDPINDPLAFRWALLPLWADEVMVHHHPPLPGDGMNKGIELGKFELSFPDNGMRAMDNDVSVEGETVIVKETNTGTLPNGVEVRIPCTLVLGVKDRRIRSYDAYYDAEAAKPLREFQGSE